MKVEIDYHESDRSMMRKSRSQSQSRPSVPEPRPTTVEVTLAGFGRRLMAWIYDLLGAFAVFILALVFGQLIIWLATFWWIEDFDALTHAVSMNPLWSLYLLACIQYYYCWCWVKGGQTMGMKTWRMQLVSADKQLLSWKQAFIRSLLSLGGIANLWSLVDKNKRGWHDIAVDSLVIVYPKGHRWVKREDDEQPLL